MDYNGELRQRVTNTGFGNAVLGFAASGAAVATFFGLRALMPGKGAEAIIVPIVSALVIGVGLFCLWHKVISLVPLLHDPAKRAGGIIVGIALTLITILISSWFIATSIGGDQAILTHMKSNVAHTERQLLTAAKNSSMERDLISDVLRVAAELEALSDAEEKLGVLSGVKGDGEVVNVLRGASNSYRVLARQMKATGQNVDEYLAEAGKQIGRLHGIIGSAEGVSASNQQEFSEQVIALQQLLTKIDRTTSLRNVRRHGILNIEYQTSSRGQKRAIESANTSMEKFTARLSNEARQVEKRRKSPEPVSYMPINAGMATWKYADDIAAAWAVGVGIDLMPLILLLLMLFSHAEAREPYTPRKPFEVFDGGKVVNE